MKLRKKHAPETDKYHPENLFKLNGEGLTWEEYKQNERGVTAPKVLSSVLRWRPKSPLLFLGLVTVADIFYVSMVIPNIKLLFSIHPFTVLIFPVLSVALGFANYSGVFQLFCMIVGASESEEDSSDDATQETSSISVRDYIKNTGQKAGAFFDRFERLEAKESEAFWNGDRSGCKRYRKDLEKMRFILKDEKLLKILNEHDLIFFPVTVGRGKLTLMAVASENNAWRWDKNPSFKHSIEGAVTYSATLDTTKLPDTITEDTGKLCEFIAKPEVQETLTARMYAHQQASRVRGVADETLPDWTTSDSVLLDDYKRVKKWYINYRDTLTEKIYDLAQAHARDLRFETDRKTSRRDAISAALSF